MTVVWIGVIGLFLTATIAPIVTASSTGTQPETDDTVTRINVDQNGSAQWTITIRTRLDTDERVSKYEAFQDRFQNNNSRYLNPFQERMQGVVANTANATDREMDAVNFTASTTIQEVPRRWGVVTYQFTWTNFAATEGETLVVGDVFQGGLHLAAKDTLEVETPAGYEIARTAPEPTSQEDGVVTWTGREDFTNQHPHVVFSPVSDKETTTGERQISTAPSDDGIGSGRVIGGILLLGLVGAGSYTMWRRRDPLGGLVAPTETESESDLAAKTWPSTKQETADATAGTEIRTDTEQVQALLEAEDGRMRQAAIADELDWTASKTSRVISDLVDEGTVEKLKLGRENLIDFVDDK